jgi:hypothetical protein
MAQKNDILSCAYTMLATECSRLKAGHSQPQANTSQPEWTSNNMMLDPKLLGSPKSPDRWWSPDL